MKKHINLYNGFKLLDKNNDDLINYDDLIKTL